MANDNETLAGTDYERLALFDEIAQLQRERGIVVILSNAELELMFPSPVSEVPA